MPPREELLGCQPVVAGHHRHHRDWHERLLEDQRRVIGALAPAARCTAEHLEKPNNILWLKSIVKLGRKTILLSGSS